MVVSQCSPIWPAPTWTSRSRRPSSGMVAKRMGSAFGRTTVVLSVEEVVGVVAQQRGRRAFGTQGVRPGDAVGDDPADVFVVVHGVILVAGAEVEDLAVSAAEGAAALAHPVQHLAVHPVDDVVRHTCSWAVWPHQVNTSVSVSTFSVSPWSGSCKVTMRMSTSSPRFSLMPAAIAP